MNRRNYLSLFITLCGLCQTINANLFGIFQKPKYSPLVFFKVPKGTSAECKFNKVNVTLPNKNNVNVNLIPQPPIIYLSIYLHILTVDVKKNHKIGDEMEKIISSVEKELNTKVQRYDILRDRFARNLYEKIDEIEFVGKVPLLYHRESRQTVYGLDTKSRVRAWAKGRWLSPKMADERGSSKKFVPDDDSEGVDGQFDGYGEEELTELQVSS